MFHLQTNNSFTVQPSFFSLSNQASKVQHFFTLLADFRNSFLCRKLWCRITWNLNIVKNTNRMSCIWKLSKQKRI